jgi:energy-converting hydrogenase Eha subunit C
MPASTLARYLEVAVAATLATAISIIVLYVLCLSSVQS